LVNLTIPLDGEMDMKKVIAASVVSAFLMGLAGNASAFWGSDDDWKCWGPMGKIPGCNPYDEWDPRYWMEEMEDIWDDDDEYGYGGYGGGYRPGGYGMPYGGGYGMPYGGGYQQPYNPYGGGYYQQPYNPYAAPAAPQAPAAPAQ